MKELLASIVREQADSALQRSVAREYLQARVLLALQDRGAFSDWAFVGGTALRFLFQLPRYSEDLDFSLAEPGRDARFETLMRGVQANLRAEAYDVDIRLRTQRTVAAAWIKFRGILHEVGISPQDVLPFLERERDTALIAPSVLLNLLRGG